MRARSLIPFLSFHSSAHRVAVAIVALSVLNGLLNTTKLLFIPLMVLERLEVWRPFTSLLLALNPFEVVFSALIIYSLGGALEREAGKRFFWFVAIGIPLIANLATVVAYTILPISSLFAYHGASMIVATLWIAYGIRAAFNRQLLNFWGAPIKGETFALIGLGLVFLNGVFAGFGFVVPEIFAVILTYAFMYKPNLFNPFNFYRKIELAYYNRKLKRIKQKSNLKIVETSRDDSDPGPYYH